MTFIDFFSGIGGFRLGMEMAGHKCLGHCEIDKYADKSYRAMHNVKEGEWYANDICRVNPTDLPEADCYCGGFPCQAFSIAGKRGGFEDTRGTLIFEFLRIVKERKPKYLFLENVAGLLNHEGGRTFATILCAISEVGYDCSWQVLNSKDYGVPQNRERVFIIGHLRGQCTGKVFPIGYGSEEANGIQGHYTNTVTTSPGHTVASYVVESEQSAQEMRQIAQLYGTETEPNPQAGRIYDSEGISPTLDTCTGGNRMPKIAVPVLTPNRPEKRQNGRRFKENGEDMFTLTAQDRHGVAIIEDFYKGREPREYTDNAPTLRADRQGLKVSSNMRIRRLTPLECFRLQGFPDEYFYKAQAVNSDSQLYKQAGNSVTVNVIYEIAQRLEAKNVRQTTR